METTNAMTVNENGNVNVESLKNSDNMEKQQETHQMEDVRELHLDLEQTHYMVEL